MENKKAVFQRRRNLVIIVILFFAIVLIVTAAQKNLSGKKYTDLVRNASPADYAGQTYGEAFDKYFDDGSWQAFQSSKDGSYVVQFRGTCVYQGSTKYALLQFSIGDDDSVKPIYVGLNEEKLTAAEQADFFADIFQ